MEKITCDQLFVNDTIIPIEELQGILKKYNLKECVVLGKKEIQNVLEYVKPKLIGVNNLLLPGSGSEIFLDILDLGKGLGNFIDVNRKIDPGSNMFNIKRKESIK